MTGRRHEFTAHETAELLAELDKRLRARGVAASLFVVGGAAVASHHGRRDRLTGDVDALTGNNAVFREAKSLARERGLPEHWLNPNASMWMPPLPRGVLDDPAEPGLRITYADNGFLLATKLIAQRAKDAADVQSLAGQLGLATASPDQLEAHIRSYYTNPGMLEMIVGGSDVDREISLLAQDAARMLKRFHQADASEETADPTPNEDRLHRSTTIEQRTPPRNLDDPAPPAR